MDVSHEFVLVLGFDMERDVWGRLEIGPGTRKRCKRALRYVGQILDEADCDQPTQVELVVAAGYSPDFPDMEISLGEIMQKFIARQGPDYPVTTANARTFDTAGEVEVFCEVVQGWARRAYAPGVVPRLTMSIVSSWWHLPRGFLIVVRTLGLKPALKVRYVPAWDRPTVRRLVLEVLKSVYLFLPSGVKRRAFKAYRRFFDFHSW